RRMELTASKTAAWTIAMFRAPSGGTDDAVVLCAMAFQSRTASARTADGVQRSKALAPAAARIRQALRSGRGVRVAPTSNLLLRGSRPRSEGSVLRIDVEPMIAM